MAFLCIAISCGLAQSLAGTIRGTILDDTGAAIPGATITATGPRQFSRLATSAADGRYSLDGLQPGTYTVQVTSPGFVQRDPVQIEINGNQASLNIVMRLAVSSESVTVHEDLSATVTTDPDANASATTVKQESLHALSD